MNCKNIQRLILLAQSGELAEKDFHRLEDHVAHCEQCQRYEDDLDDIVKLAQRGLPAGEPSEAVIDAIRSEAERSAGTGRVRHFPRIAIHAMAYAAAILIAVTGWMTFHPNGRQGRIDAVVAILAMTEDTETETNGDVEPARNEDDLRALANDLLRMEGFLADDMMTL